jgi:hypothetical protein
VRANPLVVFLAATPYMEGKVITHFGLAPIRDQRHNHSTTDSRFFFFLFKSIISYKCLIHVYEAASAVRTVATIAARLPVP